MSLNADKTNIIKFSTSYVINSYFPKQQTISINKNNPSLLQAIINLYPNLLNYFSEIKNNLFNFMTVKKTYRTILRKK